MSRFFITLLAAASFAFSASAQICPTAPEQQAFNVIALKSYLMVAALSCHEDAQYNQFMAVYQPLVAREQRVLDLYFQRAGGMAGRSQEDGYVTQLANSQSEASLRAGAIFCQQEAAFLFGTVLKLSKTADLTGFLSANPPPQPAYTADCAADPGNPGPAPAGTSAESELVAAQAAPTQMEADTAPDSGAAWPIPATPGAADAPPPAEAEAEPPPVGDDAAPPAGAPVSQETAAEMSAIAAKSLYRAYPPPEPSAPRARLASTSRTHRLSSPPAKKPKAKADPFKQMQLI